MESLGFGGHGGDVDRVVWRYSDFFLRNFKSLLIALTSFAGLVFL